MLRWALCCAITPSIKPQRSKDPGASSCRPGSSGGSVYVLYWVGCCQKDEQVALQLYQDQLTMFMVRMHV